MKRLYILAGIVLFVFSGILSQEAHAQQTSDDATANVTLNIFTTISVENAGDLEVSLFPDALPFDGTFTFDPDGSLSAGDGTLIDEVSPAEFEINFAEGQEVDVEVTGSTTFDIADIGGGTTGTVTFDDFTVPGGGATGSIIMGGSLETFRLGYTVTATGVEAGDNITDTTTDNPISVTVSYQ